MLFFGVCTTAVNVGTYYVSFNVTELSNVISTIIAWILAVLFAYFTNKIWVFDSKSFDKNVLIKEIPAFFRMQTGNRCFGCCHYVFSSGYCTLLWNRMENHI